ncbi:MAG: M23 family metallopeptidase [Stackebrandtia sp.]
MIAAAAVAAAAIAIPVGFANADVSADAKPDFLMPYACGKTFNANNWSGHSPNNTIDWQSYNGDDINGEPALASAAGEVVTVEDRGNTSYGKFVEVSHADGWLTLYAHLQKFSVSVGDKVEAGTELGITGATGGVTGPHLHFEQRKDGSVQTPVISGVEVPYGSKKVMTSENCDGEQPTNPYTAEEVCGEGYAAVDSAKVEEGDKLLGTVALLRNESGEACVATLKGTQLGSGSEVAAYLEVAGEDRVTDSGSFDYYAGPITHKAAADACLKWGGTAEGVDFDGQTDNC